MVLVRIRTPLFPTEDPQKVHASILRLWPDATITDGSVTGDEAGPGGRPGPGRLGASGTSSAPGPPGTARVSMVVATSRDVASFRQRVWELRIIDAVRGKMLHGVAPDGQSLVVHLSKQAALAGKVSFPPTRHDLGDLEVRLEVEPGDPWGTAEELAWWIAPETKDGEVVGATGPA